MADILPLPPQGTPFIDPRTKQINVLWQNYFLALDSAASNNFAPRDARFWVSTTDGTLTDETNIGLLATGYVKVVTAVGVATPSTTATIPAADIAAGTAGINISGNAATATLAAEATALDTARTINGTAFDGTANITVTAAAATLTGTQVPLARGGTGADLSATGGASQVVKQASAGGVFTVGQLASTDISGVTAGTYTPTLTGVANVTATTAYLCQYLRVGTFVTVTGRLDVDPTLGISTQVGISLPVASNFTTTDQCAGTAACPTVAAQSAAILGDLTNDRAQMEWIAVTLTNQPMYFTFGYQIL